MRILLTGASGFIGRHLAPELEQSEHKLLVLSSNKPVAITRESSRLLHGDIHSAQTYESEVLDFQPEVLIHLAWSGLPNYSLENCYQNLTASIRLVDVALRSGCRTVIATGTCWEYGDLSGSVKESDRGERLSLFAATKVALQSVGEASCRTVGGRFFWVRPFFVYGPGQRFTSLIPSCYESFLRGESPKILNPHLSKDFIHAADVANAIRTLVESSEDGGVFNIGSGRLTSVKEVVNLVAKIMGRPKVFEDERVDNNGEFWADIRKLVNLGWSPSRSLELGVADTIKTLGSMRI